MTETTRGTIWSPLESPSRPSFRNQIYEILAKVGSLKGVSVSGLMAFQRDLQDRLKALEATIPV